MAASSDGALIVDIRPAAQRAAEGEVPGSLVSSGMSLSGASTPPPAHGCREASYDLRVIIMCSAGYTSSLAAAALQDLGIRHATDLDGGFLAWQAAGLPVGPAGEWPLIRAVTADQSRDS